MSKYLLKFLIATVAIGVGFGSLSIGKISFITEHSDLDISLHSSHDGLDQFHTHSHKHSDNSHGHGSDEGTEGEPHEHNHRHMNVSPCSCLPIVKQEPIQDEHKYFVQAVVFYYEKLSYGHFPSEILRPPITSQA